MFPASTGSLEAAFSVLALRDGVAPHTVNLVNPDPQMVFTLVKDAPVGVASYVPVCIRRSADRVAATSVLTGPGSMNPNLFLKKNQNAPRPSEHPPVRGKNCQNV